MKPNWKDAPEWAQWLAQDFKGVWYWYENKPSKNADGLVWVNNNSGCLQRVPLTNYNWQETLEQREQVQQ